MISRNSSLWLLFALTAALALIAVLLPPIPQPQSYHHFADQRSFLGIPHFADVTSNFPFAVVGVWGLIFLFRRDASATTGPLLIRANDGRICSSLWVCS